MSFFSRWGKKSKGKDNPPVLTATYTQSQTADKPQHSAGGAAAAQDNNDFKDAPAAGRRDRNLSISRSGRHKVKKTTRQTVMEGEFYSAPKDNNGDGRTTAPPPSQQQQQQKGSAAWGTSSGSVAGSSQGGAHSYCRDTGSNSSRHGLSGSQRHMHHASQPTAV